MSKCKVIKPKCIAQLTLGTVPGYNVDNLKGLTFEQFCTSLQCMEENFFKEPISWLVFPAKAVYKKEWGAPAGGENVYVLQASYTDEYDSAIGVETWKLIVEHHAQMLGTALEQSTIRLQFI